MENVESSGWIVAWRYWCCLWKQRPCDSLIRELPTAKVSGHCSSKNENGRWSNYQVPKSPWLGWCNLKQLEQQVPSQSKLDYWKNRYKISTHCLRMQCQPPLLLTSWWALRDTHTWLPILPRIGILRWTWSQDGFGSTLRRLVCSKEYRCAQRGPKGMEWKRTSKRKVAMDMAPRKQQYR